MNVQGKIYRIFETQKVSEKFSKREFVVETQEQYPQKIKMEFVQDNCQKLNGFKQGDLVDVSINLRGREWVKDGKEMFFNTLQAWRIQKLDGAQAEAVDAKIEESNDLPF